MNKLEFTTKAIIVKDNKVLCVYIDAEDGNRHWDLPGGKTEFGEEPEVGLLRTIREELSCDTEIIKLIDTWSYMPNDKLHIVGVFYLCRLLSKEIQLSAKYSGYQWVEIDKLSKDFTTRAFMKRIERWNWEELLDTSRRIVYPIEFIEIDKLIPNNLYLNGDKIEKLSNVLASEFDNIIPPVLVTIIAGEYSLIDGHSRAYRAMTLGKDRIKAIVKPLEVIGMEKVYKRILEIAKSKNLYNVGMMKDRILFGKEHEKKWVGFCSKLMTIIETELKS